MEHKYSRYKSHAYHGAGFLVFRCQVLWWRLRSKVQITQQVERWQIRWSAMTCTLSSPVDWAHWMPILFMTQRPTSMSSWRVTQLREHSSKKGHISERKRGTHVSIMLKEIMVREGANIEKTEHLWERHDCKLHQIHHSIFVHTI